MTCNTNYWLDGCCASWRPRVCALKFLQRRDTWRDSLTNNSDTTISDGHHVRFMGAPLLNLCLHSRRPCFLDRSHGSRDCLRLTRPGRSLRRWRCSPLIAPGMPTATERTKHEVDHCPYQAWCRSCVGGRGQADARHMPGRCTLTSRVGRGRCRVDCCGLRVHGRSGQGWQDGRLTGACQSSCTVVVERKGAGEWSTTVATRDISLSGLKEFVYKSDGERSIVTLKQEVARRRRSGCRSDRSAVRGESLQREPGQRGGPAGGVEK